MLKYQISAGCFLPIITLSIIIIIFLKATKINESLIVLKKQEGKVKSQ
jgi:hypothetical protein